MIKHAMILAAGRGERMRPLTDSLPKPLLTVNGKALLDYHIDKLLLAGVERIVINHAWLGDKIVDHSSRYAEYPVEIVLIAEQEALETAGGIVNALPLLCSDIESEPFIVINGDVFTDFPVEDILTKSLDKHTRAHLVLVPNPQHNQGGDFSYDNGVIGTEGINRLTFSGIGLYRADFFAEITPTKQALGPLLRDKIVQGVVTAEKYEGNWCDVGTPERLSQLNQEDA